MVLHGLCKVKADSARSKVCRIFFKICLLDTLSSLEFREDSIHSIALLVVAIQDLCDNVLILASLDP